ncbi:putative surface-anchored fimbrial subunit [Corynebacterium kutscheri]|uniref:DUF5979 domain-containing protein n=2 Tax=Corynebacterium kutscheri TaxID=35755 RepID=A0A0F6R150_9CORY|nr:hypothetical protein UL82_07520 [Corynebacterium kutscheri]VEH09992.1 putative surface-anchored fimbrial subunit [Corynebacterium kutscheri]VEH80071.1 putative surface-anchored fimbrial subunit [Corynebacterium kutscheri]
MATKRLIKSPWFAVLLTLLLITSTITLITPYTPYATAQEACAGDSSCTTRKTSDEATTQTSDESEELTDNMESLEDTDTIVPSEKKSLIASFIETIESILSVAHKAKDNDKGTFIVRKQNAVFEEDGSLISIPELAEKDFTFDWMCTLPTNAQTESGSFTLRDTETFTSKKFPAGTQCTITEDLQSAQVPGYSHEVFISTKNLL